MGSGRSSGMVRGMRLRGLGFDWFMVLSAPTIPIEDRSALVPVDQ
jgi:hypothetical protein